MQIISNKRYAALMILVFIISLEYIQPNRIHRQTGPKISCETPEKATGTCIKIKTCNKLYDLALANGTQSTTREYLRKHFCGNEGKDIKVCCPINNIDNRNEDDFGSINSPGCGRSNLTATRIVGGKRADLGSWPWMAALGYINGRSKSVAYLCGGTLITKKHVLTAAHCLHGTSGTLSFVRLGDLDLNEQAQDGATPITVLVDQIIPHPNYSRTTVKNDIAIIKLKSAVTFTNLIKPLCLPITTELKNDLFLNRQPYITGWGSTQYRGPMVTHLRENVVPVVQPEQCIESYRSVQQIEIDNTVICAGGEGNDTCQGDSGGPLVLPHKSAYYLIGIVSFGIRCAEKEYPGVYTRVSSFIDWINANVR